MAMAWVAAERWHTAGSPLERGLKYRSWGSLPASVPGGETARPLRRRRFGRPTRLGLPAWGAACARTPRRAGLDPASGGQRSAGVSGDDDVVQNPDIAGVQLFSVRNAHLAV